MTITKSGELASFYTINKAPIKHLRVYFSPKQAGEGDPSPENVREISGWNKVTINSVPDEYQEVEYIESPGSSSSTSSGVYIDTKIIPYLGLCSEMMYKSKGSGYAYGSIYTSNTDYYGWNTTNDSAGRIQPYLGTGRYPSIYNYSMNNFHKLTINNKKFYIDDILIYDYNDSFNTFNFTNATSIYIGALHSSTPIMTPGQFKTTYFWDNLTKNYLGIFVPCYRKSDNTVGMYDIITKKFFQSETNQSFIAGPNVSNIIQMDWSNDIGTIYGGYVDLITGELVQTHNRLILDGSEQGWIGATSNEIAYIEIPEMKSGTWYTDSSALCNYAKKVNTSSNDYFECLIGYNNKKLYFYNAKTVIQDVSDLESFKAWLSTHNIIVTYPIDILVIHQLTTTQLSTFIGRNNIWSNADRVEVEYDLAESNDELYKRRNIILSQSPHLESASGTIAHFNTNLNKNIQSAKFYFTPIQSGSGDPSPSNIREISGYTGLDITACGINVLHCTMDNYNANGVKVTSHRNSDNEVDYYTITGTATKTNNLFMNLNYTANEFHWPPYNITYATNAYSSKANIRLVANSSPKDRNNHNETVAEWLYYDNLTPSNGTAEWIRIQIIPYIIKNIDCSTTIYPMVCLEEDAGCEFEPYKGRNITVNWNTIAGTIYGGYVDLIKGKLVQTYKTRILNGSENDWGIYQHPTYGDTFYIVQSDKKIEESTSISDLYTNVRICYGSSGKDKYAIFCDHEKLNRWYFRAPNNNITTISEWQTWLSENNITIVYKLATPIEYPLIPQQLTALKGVNNIWSNANGPIEIQYWKH